MGEDVEALKRRVPLLEYLQQHNWTGRPVGRGEYVGLCPLHEETRPSFYVNRRKDVFSELRVPCFSCTCPVRRGSRPFSPGKWTSRVIGGNSCLRSTKPRNEYFVCSFATGYRYSLRIQIRAASHLHRGIHCFNGFYPA